MKGIAVGELDDSSETISEFIDKGFVTLSGCFSKEDINIVSTECLNILEKGPEVLKKDTPKSTENNFKIYDNHHSVRTPYNTVNRKILGLSKNIDSILEGLFSSQRIRQILETLLGSGYKLYTCMIRSTTENSSFVGMHQDSFGQVSMAILLNDIHANHATTNFLEGSHLYPFKFGVSFESIPMKFLERKMTPCTGMQGDISIFFNKTFHGMQESKVPYASSVLLCSFMPVGYPYHAWILPDKTSYGLPFLKIGNELSRLLKFDRSDFAEKNGELVIDGDSDGSSRLIDQVANPERFSLLSRLKAIYWIIFAKLARIVTNNRKLKDILKKIYIIKK